MKAWHLFLILFAFANTAGRAAELESNSKEEKALSLQQVLELHGRELFGAAKELSASELSEADLIAISGKLAVDVKSAAEDDQYQLTRFFEEACEKAGPHDVDQLAGVYARIPPEASEKESLFKYLAAPWIYRELLAIKSEHPQVKLPEVDLPLPPEIKNASSEFQDAYLAFKRARQPYQKAFFGEQSDDVVSYQNNQKSFFALIEKVVSGHEKGLAEALLPYVWSGGCGMGSASVEGPQSLAIFMSLLRERRLAEAVGAALSTTSSGIGGGCDLLLSDNDKVDVAIEFLKVCGLNWEELLAGGELDAESSEGFIGWHSPFLCRLAALGSDHAASLVEKMARQAKPDARELYVRAIGALVEKAGRRDESEEDEMIFSSSDIKRIATVPISTDTRKKLLEVLQDFSRRDVSNQLAAELLSSLKRAHDRNAVPALRLLLQHPSPEIATESGRLLRGMGEKVDINIKADPVRFRLLIDGKPLPAGSDVSCGVAGVSTLFKVDEDGIVAIERAWFVDPTRKPEWIDFERNDVEGRPWFVASIPATANLDAVRTVTVETGSIELVLQKSRHITTALDQQAHIEIRPDKDEHDQLKKTSTLTFPSDKPIVIDGLQVGPYHLSILVLGHELWEQTIVATAESRSRKIQLKPGSDVHVKIFPENQTRDRYADLLNDGKTVEGFYTDETDTYRGLPVGNYVLHIPSANEVRSLHIPGEDSLGPDEIDYAARDVPFVISENSPALIDLGEIRLEENKK